ncbi:hypothetical protein [Nocardia sp. XZ_19_231]|uniref:hypothetical protein n=1 Tax=Nocardia sp. XZ_19_231 TaxID=2769252 RepID=UPI00188DF923|nr:hypothetical protein [Nocardia sp. XZ_19_231]
MTDALNPDDPADIAPWSPESLFSERHSDATGPDLGQVPGNELPTFSAAGSGLADR